MSSLGTDVSLKFLQQTIKSDPEAVKAALNDVDSTQPPTLEGVLATSAQEGEGFEAALWQRLHPEDQRQVEDTGRKILQIVLRDGTEWLRSKTGTSPAATHPSPTTPAEPFPTGQQAAFNYRPWIIGGGALALLILALVLLKR